MVQLVINSRVMTVPDVQFVACDGVVVMRRLHRCSVRVAARRVLHCHWCNGCDISVVVGGGGMRTPSVTRYPQRSSVRYVVSYVALKTTHLLSAVNSFVNRRSNRHDGCNFFINIWSLVQQTVLTCTQIKQPNNEEHVQY